MGAIAAVCRTAGDRPGQAKTGRLWLLPGLFATCAAMALPVSAPLESADPVRVDVEAVLPASVIAGKPLALPFEDRILTGNSNLDLLLEAQRVAPVPTAASRAEASAGPARSAVPAAPPASRRAGFLPDLLFAADARLEGQAPARREWLAGTRSAEGASTHDVGRSDLASAADQRALDLLAGGVFGQRLKQLMHFLRENRGWVLVAAGSLLALGAALKAFSRRI